MKKKKASLGGWLFYTFGTVLLLSLTAICIINFSRDGRVFQKPVLTAAKSLDGNTSKDNNKTDQDNEKTIKYTRSNGSKTASGEKKAGTKSVQKKADTNNAGSSGIPANPGENP